ncbi:ankyrin repeat domain-containing protein 60-like [Montipora foliosa]|uniref:ankyrin repeat domain-containing protein 60-like n=1 Tax=Montipora foliosa TaxID=591990 RepID=UPI0035F13CD5
MVRQPTCDRNRAFTVKIVLPFDEKIEISDVFSSTGVLELKDRIEVLTGIPRHLQRLTYLDDMDMDDKKNLSFFHVVPNSTFKIKLWPHWISLMNAAYYGDVKGVMNSHIRQVVAGRGFFKQMAFNHRGYVALFIASHRGHAHVVSRLIDFGITASRKMPSGRSAIHVAIFKKRVNCVNLLIGKAKGIQEEDKYRENCVRRNTFLNVAQQLTRKDGWRMLVTQLKERLGRQGLDDSMRGRVPLREFQKYDSAFPAYLKGSLGRLYLCTVLQTEPFRPRRFSTPWK